MSQTPDDGTTEVKIPDPDTGVVATLTVRLHERDDRLMLSDYFESAGHDVVASLLRKDYRLERDDLDGSPTRLYPYLYHGFDKYCMLGRYDFEYKIIFTFIYNGEREANVYAFRRLFWGLLGRCYDSPDMPGCGPVLPSPYDDIPF